MMYCTGGVRCERASSLLKSQLGEDAQVGSPETNHQRCIIEFLCCIVMLVLCFTSLCHTLSIYICAPCHPLRSSNSKVVSIDTWRSFHPADIFKALELNRTMGGIFFSTNPELTLKPKGDYVVHMAS